MLAWPTPVEIETCGFLAASENPLIFWQGGAASSSPSLEHAVLRPVEARAPVANGDDGRRPKQPTRRYCLLPHPAENSCSDSLVFGAGAGRTSGFRAGSELTHEREFHDARLRKRCRVIAKRVRFSPLVLHRMAAPPCD